MTNPTSPATRGSISSEAAAILWAIMGAVAIWVVASTGGADLTVGFPGQPSVKVTVVNVIVAALVGIAGGLGFARPAPQVHGEAPLDLDHHRDYRRAGVAGRPNIGDCFARNEDLSGCDARDRGDRADPAPAPDRTQIACDSNRTHCTGRTI